jgi:hypothetical protein
MPASAGQPPLPGPDDRATDPGGGADPLACSSRPATAGGGAWPPTNYLGRAWTYRLAGRAGTAAMTSARPVAGASWPVAPPAAPAPPARPSGAGLAARSRSGRCAPALPHPLPAVAPLGARCQQLRSPQQPPAAPTHPRQSRPAHSRSQPVAAKCPVPGPGSSHSGADRPSPPVPRSAAAAASPGRSACDYSSCSASAHGAPGVRTSSGVLVSRSRIKPLLLDKPQPVDRRLVIAAVVPAVRTGAGNSPASRSSGSCPADADRLAARERSTAPSCACVMPSRR